MARSTPTSNRDRSRSPIRETSRSLTRPSTSRPTTRSSSGIYKNTSRSYKTAAIHNSRTANHNNVTFSKDQLDFINEPPDLIEIECPICLQVMTQDPHLTSCGHHFCGQCIKRVQESNGPCPNCKEKNFTTLSDKDRLRIIKGLQVYCTNKKSGCQWKGELKDLIGHVNDGKRDEGCKFEKVRCRYECTPERFSRRDIDSHEKANCPCRPIKCEYCGYIGKKWEMDYDHYDSKCPKYPLNCANKCTKRKKYPRESLQSHLDKECPLQPVECEFKWAGCRERPLRKDLPQHVNNSMMDHFKLLAVACGEMKKENEEMKKENEGMKKQIEEIKLENDKLKRDNDELNEKFYRMDNRLDNVVGFNGLEDDYSY